LPNGAAKVVVVKAAVVKVVVKAASVVNGATRC